MAMTSAREAISTTLGKHIPMGSWNTSARRTLTKEQAARNNPARAKLNRSKKKYAASEAP